MKKFASHVCLVNDHPLENVLPLLDPQIAPQKVVLCVSPSHQNDAVLLAGFILSKGIECEIYELPQKHSLADLQVSFLELNSRLTDYAVNLSGGSKLMCMAAYEFLTGLSFCVEGDKLYTIDVDLPDYDLANQIQLEDFFKLHGWQVKGLTRRRTVRFGNLIDQLLEGAQEYEKHIGLLNKLANDADDRNSLKTHNNRPFSERQLKFIELLFQAEVIVYFDEKSLHFSDREAVDFCRGFWLEDAAYLAMKKLELQDCAISVEITNNKGVKNEIDAAFLHDNQLYLMECKTAQMAREGKGTQSLYKMDTLKEYAGLHTKGILATYRGLEDYDLSRAKDLGISIIQGQALKKLDSHLKKLIS